MVDVPSMNCRIQENDQDLDSRRKEVREKECYLGGLFAIQTNRVHYIT